MASTAAPLTALAGKGAVEIDHMQPLEALVLEGLGLRGRVVIVDGRLVHVAELEAHALAVLEVDGGKQDHAGLPPQEIGDQRQAERLALFRVELRADHIVARHGGGDRRRHSRRSPAHRPAFSAAR